MISQELRRSESPAGLDSPYVGLVPYAATHAAYFFGRKEETDVIATNLRVARLTILYGPSGVGKSSVIAAGVLPELDRYREEFFVLLFNDWRDDPIVSLDEAFGRTVDTARRPPDGNLTQRLRWWQEAVGRKLLVIFDQFEELFLYHPTDEGPDSFVGGLPAALSDPDLRANFLLSLREDALAKLDRFKGRVPNLFSNYLRVRHLDREAGREAIEGPLRVHNQLTGSDFRVEEGLIDQVLFDTQTRMGERGAGGIPGAGGDGVQPGIETTHLQLVMTRIWEEERAGGSQVLHLETLQRLGGGESIVGRHLDDAMSRLSPYERHVASSVFGHLVTPTGSKIAHTATDLAAMVEEDEATVVGLLERLAAPENRILRSVEPPPDRPTQSRFEIYHDVLAQAVLAWRIRHEHQHELDEARVKLRKERRRRLALSGFLLLTIALAVLSWVLFEASARERARQLAAAATAQIAYDPARGLETALDAVDEAAIDEAKVALRMALNENHLVAELIGHQGAITALDVSDDGRLLATASRDSTVRIWEMPTGNPVTTLEGHVDWVNDVEFSPNGALLVSAGGDFKGIVWDAGTGEVLHELVHHVGSVVSAHFSPDSRAVALASHDGSASVWNTASGELEETYLHDNLVYNAEFSPDGTRVVTASEDGRATVWVRNGERTDLGPFGTAGVGHTSGVVDAAFSPEGEWVGTAGPIGEAYLWPLNEGAQQPPWLGANSDLHVQDIEFGPTADTVITAVGKDVIAFRRVDLLEGDPFWSPTTMTGHTDWVWGSDMSEDGQLVLSWSGDGTARLWELANSRELASFRGHKGEVLDATFSADGSQVVTGSADGIARIFTLRETRTLRAHDDWVLGADVLESTGRLVSVGKDGKTVIWDLSHGTQFAEIPPSDFWALTRTSAAGDTFVTGGEVGQVVMMDAQGSSLAEFDSLGFTGAAASVSDLDYHSGTGEVAIGLWNGPLWLWSWETGEAVELSTDIPQRQQYVALHPDGSQLASGGREGGSILLWDLEERTVRSELPAHEGGVLDLEFDASGERLLSASEDGTIRVWEVSTEEVLAVLEGHEGRLSAAAFSLDGSLIVTGASDGTVGIWDSDSGENLTFRKIHSDFVNDVGFTSDGRVFSASDDHTVRLFECDTCGDLQQLTEIAKERLSSIQANR